MLHQPSRVRVSVEQRFLVRGSSYALYVVQHDMTEIASSCMLSQVVPPLLSNVADL